MTVTLEEARGRLDAFAAEHAELPEGMRRAAVSVVAVMLCSNWKDRVAGATSASCSMRFQSARITG